ncbi:acetate--CoA ligase family protein [Microvirga zambiensis]|uniref:acetate--CoA ligase family protein n=1 Tax=Microvirga zambiensis TaxID=1402137 RepID=UPI00191FC6AF
MQQFLRGRSAIDAIEALMEPSTIAFVGASADPEKSSGQPIRNVSKVGYSGQIIAVNRRGEAVGDAPVYRSVAEIPGEIDVAFVTIPAAQCPQVVDEVAAKGAKVAVMAVGGFAELGTEAGRKLSHELLAASRRTGVRIVGPVCNGTYSTPNSLALGYNAIHGRRLKPGSVALVSHSGALVAPFVSMLEASGCGLSRYVSAGSELDLGLSDFIRYLAGDPETSVIALILDHVGDGRAFLDAVGEARRAGKQIVALKLGNSALGSEATLAHSSHLSGKRQVYDAVFAASGIRSAPTVECMALTCALISKGRVRGRGGVVASSTSGGGAIILADLLSDAAGIEVPRLADETVSTISGQLRFGAAQILNPFDLGLGGRDHYIANVAALAADPSAAVLVVFGTPMSTPAKRAQLADAVVGATRAQPDLPVIYLSPAPLFDDERLILESNGVPICSSTLDAVAVARAMMPVETPADEAKVSSHAGPIAVPEGTQSEYRSKRLLSEMGLNFPSEHLVSTLAEARAAAAEIGYPVVFKASGHGIWHKSELGLVEVALGNQEELSAAWERLQARLANLSGIELDGFLVGSFVAGGVEAIVGFTRDAEFGPVAILGPGGAMAELFGPAAVRHLILPVTREAVARAIDSGPLGSLVEGFRGGPPLDREAFEQFVVDAAGAVERFGDAIQELDLNPVKILPRGGGVWPLDALCVFESAAESHHS